MEERTGWRGQNESQIVGEKRSGRLVGAAETSKERAEWHRLQRKNLSVLGLLKRKEWPQCHRESSCQERQSRLCQKEQSRLSRVPGHEGGESQGGREPHLARERRIGKRQRSQKIIDEEREKYRAENGSLRNTSTDSKGAAFVILSPTRKIESNEQSKELVEMSL